MTKHGLDQPANVLWIPEFPSPGMVSGGSKQFFSRLEDAVRFAIEKIPADVRHTAWITVDEPSIMFDEIKQIYADLGAPD